MWRKASYVVGVLWEHPRRTFPQQTPRVVWFNLHGRGPRLSGRARSECQLCVQRYVSIICCRSAPETRATQAEQTDGSDGIVVLRANLFPPIMAENKHTHVRQQMSSKKPQTVKLGRHVCMKSFCVLRKHRHTRPHRALPTASPLTSLEPRGPHYPHCTSPVWTIADSNVTPTAMPHQRHPNCYDVHNCTHTHAPH